MTSVYDRAVAYDFGRHPVANVLDMTDDPRQLRAFARVHAQVLAPEAHKRGKDPHSLAAQDLMSMAGFYSPETQAFVARSLPYLGIFSRPARVA